jgi:hypothetical protein
MILGFFVSLIMLGIFFWKKQRLSLMIALMALLLAVVIFLIRGFALPYLCNCCAMPG